MPCHRAVGSIEGVEQDPCFATAGSGKKLQLVRCRKSLPNELGTQVQPNVSQLIDGYARGFQAARSFGLNYQPKGSNHWEAKPLGNQPALAVIEDHSSRLDFHGKSHGRGFATVQLHRKFFDQSPILESLHGDE